MAAIAEEALHCEDPWTGFSTYTERLRAAMATDRGPSDLFTVRLPNSQVAAGLCDRQSEALGELVRRAREAGALPDDFVREDVFLFLVVHAGVTQVTRCAAPPAWRRLVAFLPAACRADSTGPLPAAPTAIRTERSLLRHADLKRACSVQDLGRHRTSSTPSPPRGPRSG